VVAADASFVVFSAHRAVQNSRGFALFDFALYGSKLGSRIGCSKRSAAASRLTGGFKLPKSSGRVMAAPVELSLAKVVANFIRKACGLLERLSGTAGGFSEP
jgi:hypothetical protein